MVGNFIADTVRGKDFSQYTDRVQKGIEIHRFIDHFTDTHPLALESRKLLYPYFGKYAQVVQDVFYDHFLARNWTDYHPQRLPLFAEKVYHTMEKHQAQLNARSERTLHYMKLHNWLAGYAQREGIDRSLKGMATRAKFQSNMEHAMPALEAHFDAMQLHFSSFMPELENAVKLKFRADLQQAP